MKEIGIGARERCDRDVFEMYFQILIRDKGPKLRIKEDFVQKARNYGIRKQAYDKISQPNEPPAVVRYITVYVSP